MQCIFLASCNQSSCRPPWTPQMPVGVALPTRSCSRVDLHVHLTHLVLTYCRWDQLAKTRSSVDGAKAVKGQAAKLHNRACLAAMPLSRPAAAIGARYPPSPPVRCGTGVAVSVALRCRSGGPEAAGLRWCLPRARSQFRPFCAGSADGLAGVVVRPPSAGAAARRVSVTVVGWLRGCLGLQAPEVDTSMPPAAPKLWCGAVRFKMSRV